MKNYKTYDFILQKSFELLLEKGYEASITEIEEAIGMTRGAIFYYFKDKNELFKKVVDRYLLEKQNIENKSVYSQDDYLIQFIVNYIDGIKNMKNALTTETNRHALQSYFRLVFDSVRYYEGFSDKFSFIFRLERSIWKIFIENAKLNKEIRQDVNVDHAAYTFQSIFQGFCFSSSLNKGLDINLL
ncbi:MAG: TetR/AcrR family transcriptional regulator [Tissierellia bacterium]|nr:TetR/AcrR family transcriptional regulator [Tissierellia bacterium]